MSRKLWVVLALLLSFALVAAACGSDDEGDDGSDDSGSTTTAAADGGEGDGDEASSSFVTLDDACASAEGLQAPEGFRVNLVTDIGKVDDGTFNQFAFEGLQAAIDCFGISDSDFVETVSEADYEANISTMLESDPDALITVGFLITSDTEAAAKANADVSFIGIDQFLTEYPANMAGVVFNEDESGYIAGTLAASLSETGVIGVVAGREDVPPVVKFVNGYTVGAQAVNPEISVLSVYNESFTDIAKGASDAAQFIGEGADVIFGAGGQTGSGGIAAAAEQGVWAIGVDQDEYFTTFASGSAPGSEFLASSAIKRVDLVTFRLIQSAIEEAFIDGILVGTAANDLITYAEAHDADLPAAAVEATEAARLGLAVGNISTGICGIDGLFLGENSACDESAGDTTTTAGPATTAAAGATTTAAGATTTTASGDAKTAALTIDGMDTTTLDVTSCSATEGSVELSAQSETSDLTVGSDGSVTYNSADGNYEGTVDTVSGTDEVTADGTVVPAGDDSADPSAFGLVADCT